MRLKVLKRAQLGDTILWNGQKLVTKEQMALANRARHLSPSKPPSQRRQRCIVCNRIVRHQQILPRLPTLRL